MPIDPPRTSSQPPSRRRIDKPLLKREFVQSLPNKRIILEIEKAAGPTFKTTPEFAGKSIEECRFGWRVSGFNDMDDVKSAVAQVKGHAKSFNIAVAYGCQVDQKHTSAIPSDALKDSETVVFGGSNLYAFGTVPEMQQLQTTLTQAKITFEPIEMTIDVRTNRFRQYIPFATTPAARDGANDESEDDDDDDDDDWEDEEDED
eukprot:PhF_6_TR12570/c1_g1_i1/m.19720